MTVNDGGGGRQKTAGRQPQARSAKQEAQSKQRSASSDQQKPPGEARSTGSGRGGPWAGHSVVPCKGSTDTVRIGPVRPVRPPATQRSPRLKRTETRPHARSSHWRATKVRSLQAAQCTAHFERCVIPTDGFRLPPPLVRRDRADRQNQSPIRGAAPPCIGGDRSQRRARAPSITGCCQNPARGCTGHLAGRLVVCCRPGSSVTGCRPPPRRSATQPRNR